MNPNYLMKCTRFKYKTSLDKGEWESPDAQEKEILALHAGINGLKSRNPTQNKVKSPKSESKKGKKDRGADRTTAKPVQRDYT